MNEIPKIKKRRAGTTCVGCKAEDHICGCTLGFNTRHVFKHGHTFRAPDEPCPRPSTTKQFMAFFQCGKRPTASRDISV